MNFEVDTSAYIYLFLSLQLFFTATCKASDAVYGISQEESFKASVDQAIRNLNISTPNNFIRINQSQGLNQWIETGIRLISTLEQTNKDNVFYFTDVSDLKNGIIKEVVAFHTANITYRDKNIYIDNELGTQSKANDQLQEIDQMLAYINTVFHQATELSVIVENSQLGHTALLYAVEKCSEYGREILGQHIIRRGVTEEFITTLNLFRSNILLTNVDQFRLQKVLSMIKEMGLIPTNVYLKIFMAERSIASVQGTCYTPMNYYYYAHSTKLPSNITYITNRIGGCKKGNGGTEFTCIERIGRRTIKSFDFNTSRWIDARYSNLDVLPYIPHAPTITAAIAFPIGPWVMYIDSGKTIRHHAVTCGREGMNGIRFNGSHNIDICVYGFSIDAFRLLQRMLNVNYKIIVSRDGLYGSYYQETNTSSGVVREIIENKADIGLDLEDNIPRSHVLSFSKSYVVSSLAFMYVRRDSVRSTGIFTPFHINLWLGILGSIVFVITFTWVLERFTPYGRHKSNQRSIFDDDGDDRTFNMIDSITYVWGTYFTGEIIVTKPKSFASRATTTVVSICAITIIAAYSANLVSYMIIVDETPPINSLIDERVIGKHPTVTAAIQEGTSLSNYLEKHPDQRLRTLYKRLKNCTFVDCVKSLKRREFDVFIYDYHTLKHIENIDKDCSLKTVKLSMSIRYNIAFRKTWTWKRRVDTAVSHIIESGDVDNLHTRWFGQRSCKAKNTFYAIDAMKLKELFVILSVSALIATLIMAIEVIWSYVSHNVGQV